MKFSIDVVKHPAQLVQIKKILWEYFESRNFDSALGDYQQELLDLPAPYGPPSGCLLLASAGEEPAGCVAFKGIRPGVCEMKRLYVSPNFQRQGLGAQLVTKIVEKATESGYERMWLDTFVHYESAARLYRRMGFHEIPAYQKYDTDNILFFERVLSV